MSDVTKLPKWAQQRIATLEANVEYQMRQAYEATTPGASDTYVDNLGPESELRGLPVGARIRFHVGKTRYSVYVQDGELHVRSDGDPLRIKPWACNSITIKTES